MDGNSGNSSADEGKRRARRMSEDESASYKENREKRNDSLQDPHQQDFQKDFRPDSQTRPRGDSGRGRREEEKPNNLHLYLSPRLLELAAELADEASMPARLYMCELIKVALLSQAGRLENRDRYTAEFVSENKRRTSSWRPGEEGEEGSFGGKTDWSAESRFADRADRGGEGRRDGRSGGGSNRDSKNEAGDGARGGREQGHRSGGSGYGKPRSGQDQDRGQRSGGSGYGRS
ncbi:MAG: hypothetical protein K8F91_14455, partial [Candidatus Obscuribacterales bacterium]|nr:hypothetical protein [Candidatus Obscuribacterales bacterium]